MPRSRARSRLPPPSRASVPRRVLRRGPRRARTPARLPSRALGAELLGGETWLPAMSCRARSVSLRAARSDSNSKVSASASRSAGLMMMAATRPLRVSTRRSRSCSTRFTISARWACVPDERQGLFYGHVHRRVSHRRGPRAARAAVWSRSRAGPPPSRCRFVRPGLVGPRIAPSSFGLLGADCQPDGSGRATRHLPLTPSTCNSGPSRAGWSG